MCALGLLPLLVKGLLIGGEEGIYLLICVLVDTAAGVAIGMAVAGGVIAETVEGDIALDEDHLHLSYLVFCEVQLLLQHFQLADGLFGGVGFFWGGAGGVDGLGVEGQAEA